MDVYKSLAITLAIWLAGLPLNGFAISTTWNWFISPATGARPLTIFEGLGLYLFAGLILAYTKTPDINPKKEDGTTYITAIASRCFGVPVCYLIGSWMLHIFMISN